LIPTFLLIGIWEARASCSGLEDHHLPRSGSFILLIGLIDLYLAILKRCVRLTWS
jgi:hypothetical protein